MFLLILLSFLLFFFLCSIQLHGPKFTPFKETTEVVPKYPQNRGQEDIEAEIYAWLQELVESTTVITLSYCGDVFRKPHSKHLSKWHHLLGHVSGMNYALWIGSPWILWFAMWRIQAGTCFLSIDCRLSFRHELCFALLGGRLGSWVLSGKLGHQHGVSKANSGSASWSNSQVKGITRSSLGHLAVMRVCIEGSF